MAGVDRNELKPPGKSVAGGVALQAVCIHVKAAGLQRLPGVGMVRGRPAFHFICMAASARFAAGNAVIGRRIGRQRLDQPGLPGREIARSASTFRYS